MGGARMSAWEIRDESLLDKNRGQRIVLTDILDKNPYIVSGNASQSKKKECLLGWIVGGCGQRAHNARGDE